MYFFQGGYYNAQSSMDNAIGMKLSLKAKVQGARADQRGMASVKRRTDGRTHAEKKSRASQFRGRSEVAISVSFGTRNSIWDSTWLAMAIGNTTSRKSAGPNCGLRNRPRNQTAPYELVYT